MKCGFCCLDAIAAIITPDGADDVCNNHLIEIASDYEDDSSFVIERFYVQPSLLER